MPVHNHCPVCIIRYKFDLLGYNVKMSHQSRAPGCDILSHFSTLTFTSLGNALNCTPLTAQEVLHRVDHPSGPGDHVADVVARLVPKAHASHQLLSIAAPACLFMSATILSFDLMGFPCRNASFLFVTLKKIVIDEQRGRTADLPVAVSLNRRTRLEEAQELLHLCAAPQRPEDDEALRFERVPHAFIHSKGFREGELVTGCHTLP